MEVNLSGRNFLKLLDFTPDEIRYLIDLSAQLKAKKKAGEAHRYLEGKNIVLLFEKTSTRTRCSFEVAGHDLGMGVTYLDPLAEKSGVVVWNGLTTEFHPTQMIADMLTLTEKFPEGIQGKKLVFMGDAQNNVANSLMVVCAKLGLHFVACGPKEQMPTADLVETCRAIAAETGGSVTLTESVEEGCKDADVIYTDIWVSMGEPAEIWGERIRLLSPYQVNAQVMSYAKPSAIFMHCLPSYHDTNTVVGADVAAQFGLTELEVTDEVFEGPQSVVFDEAENRMHSIKAIMYATLK